MSQSKMILKCQPLPNKIHFRTKAKKEKNRSPSDLVPLSVNIFTIDNPKNLIFIRKKQRRKVDSKQLHTTEKRIVHSELHHYRKKSLSLEKYELTSKEDQNSFCDHKMVFGDFGEKSSKNKAPELMESKNLTISIPDLKTSLKSIESIQPRKINQMDRYINQKEILQSSTSKRSPQRSKMSTSIQKERKVAFPSIGIQKRQKNDKNIIHLSELMNFEEKDKLDGWNLNSPVEENERKIDIIEYTKKSAGSIGPSTFPRKKIK